MRLGSGRITIFRKTPVEEMEYDVLMAAHELGAIRGAPSSRTKAATRLLEKYKSEDERQQLTVVICHLTEERLVYPYFNQRGEWPRDGDARAITSKGVSRLKELDAPSWAWLAKNWFPAAIALATLAVSITGIVFSAIR